MKDSLQAASIMFFCKRCQGNGHWSEEREAGLENCRYMFEMVESFQMSYSDAALTSSGTRSEWKKFRELAPFFT